MPGPTVVWWVKTDAFTAKSSDVPPVTAIVINDVQVTDDSVTIVYSDSTEKPWATSFRPGGSPRSAEQAAERTWATPSGLRASQDD